MARKKKAPAKKTSAKKAVKKRASTSVPFDNYPEWTKPRFFSFLRSALRSASSRYPPKYECLNKATRPYVGPDKRRKKERQCAKCKGWFPTTQTSADHIIPAGSLQDWDDLVPFVQRLFCSVDGFQCLCHTCHAEKTALERKQKQQKDNNKND